MADYLFNLSILMIDDQPFVRKILRLQLGKLGLTKISEAPDGAEGLALVDSAHPDIILCDLKMKGMGGFEFVENLRNKKSPANDTPVIFLTSQADSSAVSKAQELKVQGYLVKPVDEKKLKAVLGRVMKSMLIT